MRTIVTDYLTANVPSGFSVSTHQPWTDGGVELYKKNPKTVYVATPSRDQEPLYTVFGGRQVIRDTRTLSVWVAVDAKQEPANFSALVETIAGAVDVNEFSKIHTRTVAMDQLLEDALMITEFTITLTNTINNI